MDDSCTASKRMLRSNLSARCWLSAQNHKESSIWIQQCTPKILLKQNVKRIYITSSTLFFYCFIIIFTPQKSGALSRRLSSLIYISYIFRFLSCPKDLTEWSSSLHNYHFQQPGQSKRFIHITLAQMDSIGICSHPTHSSSSPACLSEWCVRGKNSWAGGQPQHIPPVDGLINRCSSSSDPSSRIIWSTS